MFFSTLFASNSCSRICKEKRPPEQCCGSGMFIPDPVSEFFPFRIQIFPYFSPKEWLLSSRKYDTGCSSRIRILIFYPSRIPGTKRPRIPDPQHCFRGRKTNLMRNFACVADYEEVMEGHISMVISELGVPHWQCSACARTFKQRHHLKDHIEALHMIMKYDCPYCGKVCRSKPSLRMHVLNHKKSEDVQ